MYLFEQINLTEKLTGNSDELLLQPKSHFQSKSHLSRIINQWLCANLQINIFTILKESSLLKKAKN